MTRTHTHEYRVYYEDTDAGGIMYHGQYIAWCERARCEYLHDLDLPFSDILEKTGVLFVVRHLNADYFKPALLDQKLRVETTLKEMKNSSFLLNQSIFCQDFMLFSMTVTIVCVDSNGRPVRIPEMVRSKLQE
ncbi:MAG: tol-pal system-associated acyl-CoA thioesterase [Micavibrio aeruginosavorus]|uniref:Tol-pal system-associated acyl-CoA thioesterase n=1 Tax=Micavibrio aeruginosavorus TaxID=349221 RepID=A0A2W5PNR2_9BACT|nr:MAG: tol-pal system-associated acyl-CoA thioesterase [Micavibrio aeruginosavorus]